MNLRFAYLVVLGLFVASSASSANQPYGWTISASSTDPFVHATTPTFGPTTYYLWLACCDVPDYPDGTRRTQGFAAAEFRLEATGIVLLAFSPPCIIINPPPFPDILLACGCTCGPTLMGAIVALGFPGSICFAPSMISGRMGAVDCEPNPQLWGMDWVGLDTTGAGVPCSDGLLCDKPVPVEDLSWGRLKTMYR